MAKNIFNFIKSILILLLVANAFATTTHQESNEQNNKQITQPTD